MISFIKPCLQCSWTRPLIDHRIVLFPFTHHRCLLPNWFIGIFVCNQAIATQNLFFHFAPHLFRSFGNIYSYIVSTQIFFIILNCQILVPLDWPKTKYRECVSNLDLRVQVHPEELWVSKQRVHIVLEASKSAGAKCDVPKICEFVHPLHPG